MFDLLAFCRTDGESLFLEITVFLFLSLLRGLEMDFDFLSGLPSMSDMVYLLCLSPSADPSLLQSFEVECEAFLSVILILNAFSSLTRLIVYFKLEHFW